MKLSKTLSVLLFFCIVSMGLSSCIGDKLMIVRYQIHNTSEDTLYLENTFDASGDQLSVPPNTIKTVHQNTKVCWMGDCRIHIKTDVLLDTLSVYQDSMQLQKVSYIRDQWKLKKNRAILKVE